MDFPRFVILIVSIVHSVIFYYSLYLPWITINLPLNQGTWEILIPNTLGYYDCLTYPCVYNRINSFDGKIIRTDQIIRKNFIQIRNIFEIFYFLSFIISLISILLNICFWKSYSSKIYRYSYPLAVCCLVICSCIYFPFMYYYLNGGSFLEGSLSLVYLTSLGTASCLFYFTESPPINHSYIPIP